MLYSDFLTNNQKPIDKWTHYFPIYERHLSKFVNQSVNFWEIGVYKGGSLQMWKRYLGPFAKIVGIDINPICKREEESQISICIGDQSDTDFLQSIINEHGLPDVVLDDGSHIMKHLCATFDFLYDKVTKNGVYIVEDLHTAYWHSLGGGLGREGTFIEYCKDMIDSLNARHISEDVVRPHEFADSTYSMSFYDSVVVFEKREWIKDSLKSIMIPYNDKTDILIYQMSNNCEILVPEVISKKISVFGGGEHGNRVGNALKEHGINIECFIDNDSAKHGTRKDGIDIISPEKSLAILDCNYIIAVDNATAQQDISNQLKTMGVSEERIWGIHMR